MACFAAPLAEAIVVSIAKKVIEKKEQSAKATVKEGHAEAELESFSKKLGLLNKMLLGGSFLLAFEHVWHGEVVPFFPFLTAASNPEDAMEMLHEIATTGVTMAILVTAIWGVIYAVTKMFEKRNTAGAELKPAM